MFVRITNGFMSRSTGRGLKLAKEIKPISTATSAVSKPKSERKSLVRKYIKF
jgi:hypothetical protein